MDNDNEVSRIMYEYKHFGFPAEVAILGVKDLVYGEIKNSVESMERAIISYNKNHAEKEKIKAISPLLIDAYCLGTVQPFEMVKEQIKQCFSIPNHVLLPDDEIQRQQYTMEEEISLHNKFLNLKSRYKRAIYLERMLLAEKKVFEELRKREFEIMKLQKSEENESTAINPVDKSSLDRIIVLFDLLSCKEIDSLQT